MPSLSPVTLADPLLVALNWLVSAATGTIATMVATLGVAVMGMLMLRGHTDWRKSTTTIIGIFVIIGAHAIALGLYSASGAESQAAATQPQPSTQEVPPPKHAPPHVYDPYAGASVPVR